MSLRALLAIQVASAVTIIMIASIVSLIIFTNSEFSRYAYNEDYLSAENIATAISSEYDAAPDRDQLAFDLGMRSFLPDDSAGNGSQMMSMMGSMRHGTGMRMMSIIPAMIHRVVITDEHGAVMLDSMAGEPQIPDTIIDNNQGVEIVISDEIYGHVFVGSMISESFDESRQKYLSRVILVIVLISFIGVLLSIIGIWSILSRQLAPLKQIISAVRQIEQGNLDVEVEDMQIVDFQDLSGGVGKMADSLKSSENQRNEHFSNIAHEIKTPLTLIQGNIEAIIDGVYALDSLTLTAMLQDVKHLNALVDDISLLANIRDGKFQVNLTRVNLQMALNEVVTSFGYQAKEMGVEVQTRFPDSPVFVRADENRLRQLISNIISNGLRYGAVGKLLEINLEPGFSESRSKMNDIVNCVIRDHGPGVSGEELPKIFERLYRGEESRSRTTGGSGLGLAISRELARSFHGDITASNHPEGGLEVVISIPSA